MKKEAIQAFTARIAQANKSELTVILYEMIQTELRDAKDAYDQSDLDTFAKSLKRAQKYVNELISTLDFKYAISYDLLSLYLYINKRIITAIIKQNPISLDSAESVLNKLYTGFSGISSQDTSGPVMRNTQQVYAGLTYGKGTLNETYIDPNQQNRGFIA
jgi:flagellar protein FliS